MRKYETPGGFDAPGECLVAAATKLRSRVDPETI
jgi:hypothetical protein